MAKKTAVKATKKPAEKATKKPAKKQEQDLNLITLTDDDGADHEFELVELFNVGKKNYALLRPLASDDGTLTILKFSMDKDGAIQGFEDPTDAEFKAAVKELESHPEGEECECDCACCEEPHVPAAPAKAAKKASTKVSAKTAAAKKPAAKPAAAKKPAAKPAAAKKPAAKKPAAKKAAGGKS